MNKNLLVFQKIKDFIDHPIIPQNPSVTKPLGNDQSPFFKVFVNIDSIEKRDLPIIFIVNHQSIGLN